MEYAAGIQEFIDRFNNALPSHFYKLPLEEQRDLYAGLSNEFHYDLPVGVTISDEVITKEDKKFSVRVYTPKEIKGDGLLFYMRGGGFVIGSLETLNSAIAELCEKSGLITIAPDFRMAPEHPFPSALEDCYEILCEIAAGALALKINPEKIVLCGDSSGANMVVVISMMLRDRKGLKPCGQALISPVLDFSRWQKGGIDAPLLTGGEMEYFTACYAPIKGQVEHPYISPIVSGEFHDLPPAYIMGTEFDSLLTDSKEYAEHLAKNETKVTLVIEPGLVHAPIRARGLSPEAANAWNRFCFQAAELAKGV